MREGGSFPRLEQRGIFGRAGGKRKRKRGLADRRVRGCWRGVHYISIWICPSFLRGEPLSWIVSPEMGRSLRIFLSERKSSSSILHSLSSLIFFLPSFLFFFSLSRSMFQNDSVDELLEACVFQLRLLSIPNLSDVFLRDPYRPSSCLPLVGQCGRTSSPS